jgi:hypothetical protein
MGALPLTQWLSSPSSGLFGCDYSSHQLGASLCCRVAALPRAAPPSTMGERESARKAIKLRQGNRLDLNQRAEGELLDSEAGASRRVLGEVATCD